MSDSNFDENNNDGSLERFKQRLERREEPDLNLRSTRLPQKPYFERRGWEESGDNDSPSGSKINRWLINFFFGATIFFLVTVAVAIYILFYSSNIVSANNINLDVSGAQRLRSGEELVLEVVVTNRNKVTLQDAVITFTYPAGTVDSLETAKEIPLRREKLGNLSPGEKRVINSRAVIFGAENSQPRVTIKLEYNIPDSNAIFSKETEYEFTIESSTLDLSLNLPEEINIGKTFSTRLTITSNAKTTLRQVGVRIEYPSGYSVQSTDPAPASGRQSWYLGDIPPGEKREIILKGSLAGLRDDLKTFKVAVGLDNSLGQGQINTIYANLIKTINLQKDFVSATIDLLGKTSVTPGSVVDGTIVWNNNLTDKVANGRLELSLSGIAIDKKSVTSNNGFYDSLSNSIIWDKQSVPVFDLINPNDSGKVNFSFKILPASNFPAGRIDPISLRAVFVGTRLGENNQEVEISSENSQSLKIATIARLFSQASYSVGPFRNTGPMQPKVGEETTYTITFTISTPTNEINNGRLVANLPSYMRWLGVFSPTDEKLIYNKSDSKVVWDLGRVAVTPSESGFSREVSFQVALVPSLSQLGGAPLILSDATFTGADDVTGDPISIKTESLSTKLRNDPLYVDRQEIVIE